MKQTKIIFDLIGVISKDGYIATNIIYPLIKKSISYELFKKKYLLYCIGNIDNKDFWQDIIDETTISLLEQKIIDNVQVNQDIIKLIKNYSSQNKQIYLASEIPARWGEMILNKCDLSNCFKQKYYSSSLKSTKPFKNFFNNIFTTDFIKDSSVFYIDDTKDNIKVVRDHYKASTIWFNNAHSQEHKSYKLAKNAKEVDFIINKYLKRKI